MDADRHLLFSMDDTLVGKTIELKNGVVSVHYGATQREIRVADIISIAVVDAFPPLIFWAVIGVASLLISLASGFWLVLVAAPLLWYLNSNPVFKSIRIRAKGMCEMRIPLTRREIKAASRFCKNLNQTLWGSK